MPVFDVLVNHNPVCHAATDSNGGLHIILSWRGPPRRGCARPLELSIMGIDGHTEESVTWAAPELQFGDEVIIRIGQSSDGDAPSERVPFDPEKLLQQQQDDVRRMAAEWGWEITTDTNPSKG